MANAKQFIAIEQLGKETLEQETVLHGTNSGMDSPLVRHPDFRLTDLTLGLWLKSMADGIETLNPAAIAKFLGRESKSASNALSG